MLRDDRCYAGGNGVVLDQGKDGGEEMKISREEQARRDGMSYALKVALESGVDGLMFEMKRRGGSLAPCILPQKDLDAFTMKVKENTIDTITALSAYILHDKFGFGNKRIGRFVDCMNEFADSICTDWLTVEDMIGVIKEETGIDLRIRKNDRNVIVKQ